MKKAEDATQSQSERFKEAARELGCDESEEGFDETLKKVAKHKPAQGKPSNGTGRTKPQS